MKKLNNNLSLLLLIGFNLYFIWYYQQHPDGLKTLFALYWLQSVSIGFFTFLQLIMAKTPAVQNEPLSSPTDVSRFGGAGCMAFFFLFHYGMFHLVYLVFIVAGQQGPLDYSFIKISAIVILLAEFMSFRRKQLATTGQSSITGIAFFLPYLRIIPMHLVLLGINIFGWKDITTFLVLKTIADVLMHLLTNALYFRQPSTNPV